MSYSKPLHVAFISRSTLYSSPGGDTIQIDKTAKYLQQLGCSVKVFTTDERIPYHEYDLFHYFNLTRPADILYHIHKSRKPFFVSPIYLDLHEFERKSNLGLRKIMARCLPGSTMEYLKCIARYLKNGEQIRSMNYLLKGHRKAMHTVLEQCTAILPNSFSEYRRIRDDFHYKGAYDIVPCGVDLEVFDGQDNSPEPADDLVLCVGRIEPRKNQLALIHALRHTEYRLLIIGNPSPNHRAYYELCKKAANERVVFIENIDQQKLIHYYWSAKVHALPSWFETVGLSSLEAAFCGCNIVVSDKGDVRDYFGDHAWYCCPNKENSILEAVTAAAGANADTMMREKIKTEYNWRKVAEYTWDAYLKYVDL